GIALAGGAATAGAVGTAGTTGEAIFASTAALETSAFVKAGSLAASAGFFGGLYSLIKDKDHSNEKAGLAEENRDEILIPVDPINDLEDEKPPEKEKPSENPKSTEKDPQ